MHQLAVIDGPTAKRRLRHVGATAELRYLAENLVVLHRAGILCSFGGQRWVTATSYHHLPNRGRPKSPPMRPLLGFRRPHRPRVPARLHFRYIQKNKITWGAHAGTGLTVDGQ